VFLVFAQSPTAQEGTQKATILSNRVVDEVQGLMGERVLSKDPKGQRLVVLIAGPTAVKR